MPAPPYFSSDAAVAERFPFVPAEVAQMPTERIPSLPSEYHWSSKRMWPRLFQ
jgi:hypothetical protein